MRRTTTLLPNPERRRVLTKVRLALEMFLAAHGFTTDKIEKI